MIVLLILLIGDMFYSIHQVNGDGFKCISSPLTYGAKVFEKNYGKFDCICSNGISFNETSVLKQDVYTRVG